MHKTGVETRGVARAEGHDAEGVLFIVGREVCELVLVAVADGNLMVSASSVEADEEEFPSGVAEVVDGVLSARNRILKRKSDAV